MMVRTVFAAGKREKLGVCVRDEARLYTGACLEAALTPQAALTDCLKRSAGETLRKR